MILNKEQLKVKQALDNLKLGAGIIINAKAGTGKTTTLVNYLENVPYNLKVAVATLSHNAKDELKSKMSKQRHNVQFFTLAALTNTRLNYETGDFEEDANLRNKLDEFDVIVIDEASMVSEQSLKIIEKKKKKSARLIFSLDFRQLPPIGEKESALLNNSKYKTIELTERVRQGKDNSILDYSDLYGDYITTGVYPTIIRTNDDNIKHYTNVEETLLDYKQDFIKGIRDVTPNNIRIVCYSNHTKNKINNLVRELIFDQIEFIPYEQGDILTLDAPYQDLDNAMELVVFNVTSEYDGRYIIYVIEGMLLGYNKPVVIKVLNNNSVEQHAIDVTDAFNLYYKDKRRKDLLEKAWELKLRYAKVSHSFCQTVYKAQGKTYNKTIILEDDIMNSYMNTKQKHQAMYVGITRSREQTIIIKS